MQFIEKFAKHDFTDAFNHSDVRITKNMIVVYIWDDNRASAMQYISDQYDEGWEIVTHIDGYYTLHKKK